MPINFIVESIILFLYRIKENVPFQMEFFLFILMTERNWREKKEKWASNAKIIKKMPRVFSARIKAV